MISASVIVPFSEILSIYNIKSLFKYVFGHNLASVFIPEKLPLNLRFYLWKSFYNKLLS